LTPDQFALLKAWKPDKAFRDQKRVQSFSDALQPSVPSLQDRMCAAAWFLKVTNFRAVSNVPLKVAAREAGVIIPDGIKRVDLELLFMTHPGV
jgi:hypothetical protein